MNGEHKLQISFYVHIFADNTGILTTRCITSKSSALIVYVITSN